MDTLASLALATDPPSVELLNRHPYPRDKPIISRKMIRFIISHALYQCLVLFTVIFLGPSLSVLEIPDNGIGNSKPTVHFTMVCMGLELGLDSGLWIRVMVRVRALG